jgi:hypothetical protein
MRIMRRSGRKITIDLVDDLDGTTATETVSFELDGRSYEIDLSRANADEFRLALRPWLDRGELARLAKMPAPLWPHDDGLEGREGQLTDR